VHCTPLPTPRDCRPALPHSPCHASPVRHGSDACAEIPRSYGARKSWVVATLKTPGRDVTAQKILHPDLINPSLAQAKRGMSRLQGWAAFEEGNTNQEDGISASSHGIRNQPSPENFHHHAGQLLGSRYNGNGMAGVPSSSNAGFMQGGGGGPSRSGGGLQMPNSRGEEEEGFLLPVSEGKADATSSMTGLVGKGGKPPSAPHSPQQLQRPIGPMTGSVGGRQGFDSGSLGGFGGQELPGSHQQLLMRNDGYMQPNGLRTSPIGQIGGRVSPTSQYPSGAGAGIGRMAGFQSIQGIPTFEQQQQQQGFKNQQPQHGGIDGMRYPTRPSPPNGASLSSSPTSQLSQSPYRYETGRGGADDLADMLSSTHLERDAQLLQSLQSSQIVPPHHQMQQV
jgi:hypothetical protein